MLRFHRRILNAPRLSLRFVPLMLIALGASALPALAVTSISSCTSTVAISTSGNYAVTADLTAAPGQDCIDITASNVSLTLNGHKITGNGSTHVGNGINIYPNPMGRLDHVSVQGPGLISQFGEGNGISFSQCDYCQVDLVTAAQNDSGIAASFTTYLTVGSNVTVANGFGINLFSCAGSTIQYNDASGNRADGIQSASGSGNIVSNNTADGNSFLGIGIFEPGSRLSSNVTNGNHMYGIEIGNMGSGVQVFNNTSSVGNGTDDLIDFNACGANLWNNNVFFTSSPVACIH